MDRARRAGIAALVSIVLLGAVVAGPGVSARPPGVSVPAEPAAAVGWPPSSGLVIAEVVTGGTSASDEWIELANAGAGPLDLVGLEVAYVTSSGSTITRKATWTASRPLDPGRHLLLANAAGVHAAIADLTYSGGLAATGGALVVRPVGGDPIDAVGWGDAVNAFVEGVAITAPPAGSSVERRPGGPLGHATDQNDNAADFLVNPLPIAQNLASPPTPELGTSPTPGPSDPPGASIEPSPSPSPSALPSSVPSVSPAPSASLSPAPSTGASPEPSPSSDPSPSPQPSASPNPSPNPSPSPSPDPDPDPTAAASPSPPTDPSPRPEPSPSAVASPAPSPSAGPSLGPSPEPSLPAGPSPSVGPLVTNIATVRAMPDGTTAAIEAVLTTDLGRLESGRGAFVQDGTGGIAVYLDAPVEVTIPAGSLVRATGEVDERYGQRTLRVSLGGLGDLGPATLPAPMAGLTGELGEPDEGHRMAVSGVIVESPSSMADGLGLLLDDGSGPLRVVAAPDALAGRTVARGDRVLAVGPLGQRDSSGTGSAGYRLFATLDGELTLIVDPSPAPSASPGPSPTPSGGPSPTPSPKPDPTPQGPPRVSIAAARMLPIGTVARVAGVVTVEPGRLGKPPLLAIEDDTAGIVVHLPDDAAQVDRGQRIEITGKLAAPYGQLEIKPDPEALVSLGWASDPTPLAIGAAALGEGLEARLVTLRAVVASSPRRATSGDLTIDVTDASGAAARIMVDARAGIAREAFTTGSGYAFTGIVGQRATRVGALDGYRIWLRDGADLRPESAPSSTPASRTGSGASASAFAEDGETTDPGILAIAGALATPDLRLGIEAVVVAGPSLLDATGRRVVAQDATGAIEILMPDALEVREGDRIRATGVVGAAYGAPRLRADTLTIMGRGIPPDPVELSALPGAALEWRLARARGLVVDVHRVGERWTAELQIAGGRLLVNGLAGSGIDAGRLPEGSTATVTGIVRRPYPTATDRRFALVPRSVADIVIASARGGGATTHGSSASGPDDGDAPAARTRPSPADSASGATAIDLGQLGEFRGQIVRIGGLVVEATTEGVLLDDGTARAWLLLKGAAAELLGDIAVGDALSATGLVEGPTGSERLVTDDPALIVLAAGSGSGPASQRSTQAVATTASPVEGGRDAIADPRLDAGREADTVPVLAAVVAMLVILVAAIALGGRRWRERRRLATLVAARLGALARDIPGHEEASGPGPAVASRAGSGTTLGMGSPGPG